LALLVIVLLLRGAGPRHEQAEEASFRAEENETRMAELLKIQAEMPGRIAAMPEVFFSRPLSLPPPLLPLLSFLSPLFL
ncbi:hypothetical protein ACC728_39555, partial [Rhizobium ruizarguesonis]